MNVPERIQELRKQKGISQEELANELGVSRQAVSKWESGQSFPELDNIVALSDFFGVSADYVLKGTETLQVTKEQTPLASKPKMSFDDRLKLFAERRNIIEATEEKEVVFQLAMTQRQKSALAMVLFVSSAIISVISAFFLNVYFDSHDSYSWIASLGVLLIGFAMYHIGKRFSAKEAPFTVKYINRASFIFIIVFLTTVHTVFQSLNHFYDARNSFAICYILAAAIVYGMILLYRKIRRLQAEEDLTQQSTK